MNAKIFFKSVLAMALAALLVMVGYYNQGSVSLKLPPLMRKSISQPAGIMYGGFFGVGLLGGALLCAGKKGKSSGGGSGSKPANPSKD